MPIGRLEAALATDAWLAGADYSIADIDAYALVEPLRDLAPEVVNAVQTPRLVQWLSRIAERPAVRAARARSRSGAPSGRSYLAWSRPAGDERAFPSFQETAILNTRSAFA